MGFQEVSTGGDYVAWKDLAVGAIGVEGWFLQPIKSVNFEHNNYVFLQRDGTKKIVNGCGYVHRAMESVKPGDMVQMIYLGKVPPGPKAKYKSQPNHQVKVLVDPLQRAIVRDGMFISMAPAGAVETTPITTAEVATQPVSAPVPTPAPEPDPTDEIDW